MLLFPLTGGGRVKFPIFFERLDYFVRGGWEGEKPGLQELHLDVERNPPCNILGGQAASHILLDDDF